MEFLNTWNFSQFCMYLYIRRHPSYFYHHIIHPSQRTHYHKHLNIYYLLKSKGIDICCTNNCFNIPYITKCSLNTLFMDLNTVLKHIIFFQFKAFDIHHKHSNRIHLDIYSRLFKDQISYHSDISCNDLWK